MRDISTVGIGISRATTAHGGAPGKSPIIGSWPGIQTPAGADANRHPVFWHPGSSGTDSASYPLRVSDGSSNRRLDCCHSIWSQCITYHFNGWDWNCHILFDTPRVVVFFSVIRPATLAGSASREEFLAAVCGVVHEGSEIVRATLRIAGEKSSSKEPAVSLYRAGARIPGRDHVGYAPSHLLRAAALPAADKRA